MLRSPLTRSYIVHRRNSVARGKGYVRTLAYKAVGKRHGECEGLAWAGRSEPQNVDGHDMRGVMTEDILHEVGNQTCMQAACKGSFSVETRIRRCLLTSAHDRRNLEG